MSIYTKTIWIVVVIQGLLFALLFLFIRHTHTQGYLALEQQELRTNLQRIEQALAADKDGLSQLVYDWAVWDDAYNFIDAPNDAFIESNISPGTFEPGIQHILFLDNRFVTVAGFERAQNLDGEPEVQAMPTASSDFFTDLVRSQILSPHSPPVQLQHKKFSGYVTYQQAIYIIAVEPVTSSDGASEPRGFLLMSRELHADRVRRLGEITALSLAIAHFATADLPTVVRSQLNQSPMVITPIDDHWIRGDKRLADLFDQPSLVISLEQERHLYQQGRQTQRDYLLYFCLAGLLTTVAVISGLSRGLLRRIAQLARELARLGDNNRTKNLLTVRGQDEIASLGKAINQLLGRFRSLLEEQLEQEKRQTRLTGHLLEIAMDDTNPKDDLDKMVAWILSKASTSLTCDRLALWQIDERRQLLLCQQLFTASTDTETGTNPPRCSLPFADNPYHEAVRQGMPVKADRLDPNTAVRTSTAGYWATHGISGYMAIPVKDQTQVMALLTVEVTGKGTLWSTEDYFFARSLAQLIANKLKIHRRLMQQKELLQQASLDNLTGLPNRSHFNTSFDLMVQQANASGNALAVLFIDLNKFKPVNDRYGHAAGDALLVELAQRFRQGLRKHDLICRLGGDEFVAVTPLADDPQTQVAAIAGKLLTLVEQPVAFEDQWLSVGCSIGVALYPHDAITPADLLAKADKAMYEAKKSSRSGYCLAQTIIPDESPVESH